MKVPSNLTEQETLDIIKKVIDRIAPKYTFYGYPADDMKQEAYIICHEALERYDEERPLENFLSVNLSNRLKNFVRDNFYIADANDDRIRVLQPAQLDYEENIIDDKEKYSIDDERIDKEEFNNFIDMYLPSDMRLEYLKIIHDVYIPKTRKTEVLAVIEELRQEFGL
jgi:DNA-directed RNA polymerase specialized sigma24 family protein